MLTDRKQIKTLLGVLCAVVFFAWALLNHTLVLRLLGALFALIAPFLAGAALAFVLSVPVTFFEKKLFAGPGWQKRPALARVLALLLTVAALAVILALVVSIVLPQLRATADTVLAGLPGLLIRLEGVAARLAEWFPSLEDDLTALLLAAAAPESQLLAELSDTVMGVLSSGAVGSILDSTVSFAARAVGTVVNVFVAVIFSLYVLMSKEKLAAQATKLLYAWCSEKNARRALYVGRLSHRVFSSFLTGQCLEAVILGALFFVVMTVLGLPYAILVAVVIGVTALIPVVGAFAGCAVGAVLIMVQDPMQALFFVGVFLVLQQLEGNLIYPRVVGSSIGLPGMWVLAAVTVGGGLFGVLGMLLTVPAAAVGYTLLRENTYRRLAEKGLSPEKPKAEPPRPQKPAPRAAKKKK